MEGFVGSIPQKFIDKNVPICPMCGTKEPHWSLNQKMGFTSNRYLFKCEKCNCILSATVGDVTGFDRTALSTTGLIKMLSGKKTSTIYMNIDDVGTMQVTQTHKNKEVELDELNEMANTLK